MAGRAFVGGYNATIDENGRFFVPVRFREKLGESTPDDPATLVMLVDGNAGCLACYTRERLDEIVEKMEDADVDIDEMIRTNFRYGQEVVVDKQGRITIPPELRSAVGLEGKCEVSVIGLRKKIEIWNKELLDRREQAREAASSDNKFALPKQFGF